MLLDSPQKPVWIGTFIPDCLEKDSAADSIRRVCLPFQEYVRTAGCVRAVFGAVGGSIKRCTADTASIATVFAKVCEIEDSPYTGEFLTPEANSKRILDLIVYPMYFLKKELLRCLPQHLR